MQISTCEIHLAPDEEVTLNEIADAYKRGLIFSEVQRNPAMELTTDSTNVAKLAIELQQQLEHVQDILAALEKRVDNCDVYCANITDFMNTLLEKCPKLSQNDVAAQKKELDCSNCNLW